MNLALTVVKFHLMSSMDQQNARIVAQYSTRTIQAIGESEPEFNHLELGKR